MTRRGGRFARVHHEEETWVDYLPTVEETPMDAPRSRTRRTPIDGRWAMGDDAIMHEGCGAAAGWERTRSSVVVLRLVFCMTVRRSSWFC